MSNEDHGDILPFRQNKADIEVARKQTAAGVAAAQPKVLAVLYEQLDHEDPHVAFRAAKLLLDKHLPSPLGERVIDADAKLEGEEVVTEDVREMREQVLRQIQAKEGGTVD